MKLSHYFMTLAMATVSSTPAWAAVELPDIVGNNMVVQQNADARLWGWATPGSKLTVSASWAPKKKVTAVTADNGRWDLELPTPSATFTPQTIHITGDDSDITIDNILVGEVWFCSGQSNMEMPLRGFNMQQVDEAPEAIAYSGKYTGIRFATVPKRASYTPQDRVTCPWVESNPENAPEFSATAFFFARALTDLLNVPVGIISCSYGGSKVEGWQSREQLAGYPEWDIDKEAADKNMTEFERINVMYNAMLHPLIGYTIKGFLWNQGESNVGRHDTYPQHQLDMVTDWREKWGLGDLPFYFVEIPGWSYGDVNGDSAAKFRECQHLAAEMTPNSGIICTSDLVHPDQPENIHAPVKRPLGERLAFMAAARTYGIKGLPVDYPRFRSMTVDGNKASLTFDNMPNGFVPYTHLEGFEAAGADGVFHPAYAWGNWEKLTVDISCPEIDEIKNVRYNFKNFAVGKIHNHLGLPIIPFRTDKD